MITVEDIEARGYRYFPHGMRNGRQGYLGIWQKAVADRAGIRYHVTLDAWDASGDTVPGTVRFAPKVQFETRGGPRTTFNCEMLPGGETIEQVEDFFERLWVSMGAARHDQGREDGEGDGTQHSAA